jgi:DNA-directed RNA polymerase specialized sigma24 family protein
VFAYFVFRLRQPGEAERLTRLTFERVWEREKLSGGVEQEPELPLFAAARAVIAENPRRRGTSRVRSSLGAKDEDLAPMGLSNELAMAFGRLDGRERDALALRFGAELSVGEIAELIDRTPAEIKQRLARGVRALIELGVLPKEGPTRKSAAKRPRAGGSKQGKPEERQAAD